MVAFDKLSKARWQGVDKAATEIERSRTALLAQWETGDRGDILYRLSGLAILESNCEQAWQYLQEAIPIWDLEVEAVIAPNMEIMQQSSSPVPFLKSGRVNLYEHASRISHKLIREADLGRKSWTF